MVDVLLLMVTLELILDIDLCKIYKELKKMNYNVSEYASSIGESYEKFWYYLSETSDVCGPFTINELKTLYDKNLITKSTLIWHPMFDRWQYYICTEELVKAKKGLPPEIRAFIESLKINNELMPVYLKQGYIHMKQKSLLKGFKESKVASEPPIKSMTDRIVWLAMTEDSLLVRSLPEEEPFLKLNFMQLQLFPEVTSTGSLAINPLPIGGLSFTIGSTKADGENFYSFFQKETLEWINEIKKVKYYKEKNIKYFTDMSQCIPGQSNLIVV